MAHPPPACSAGSVKLRAMTTDHTHFPGAAEPRWVVLDVETTGTDPAHCRIISLAALTIGAGGAIEKSVASLLDAGVDAGPTHIHGITTEMLAGQPRFADIATELTELLGGRTLVAHNVAFDYAFLEAEARRVGIGLPIQTVMCTVELAARLSLDVEDLKLATVARHWNIPQTRPHDALDDAWVLSQILACAVERARELAVPLPIRHPGGLQPPTFPATAG